jgi:hypothetical protein
MKQISNNSEDLALKLRFNSSGYYAELDMRKLDPIVAKKLYNFRKTRESKK